LYYKVNGSFPAFQILFTETLHLNTFLTSKIRPPDVFLGDEGPFKTTPISSDEFGAANNGKLLGGATDNDSWCGKRLS
jgi:hypothetical protein